METADASEIIVFVSFPSQFVSSCYCTCLHEVVVRTSLQRLTANVKGLSYLMPEHVRVGALDGLLGWITSNNMCAFNMLHRLLALRPVSGLNGVVQWLSLSFIHLL